MIIPGPNDQQFVDFDQAVNGAEQLQMASVQVPPNFLGCMEIHLYGKITDTETQEEGYWTARLTMMVKRAGNSGWVALTSLAAMPGHSANSPNAAGFGSSFIAVNGGDASMLNVMLNGVAGKSASFQSRISLVGATLV